MTTKSTSTEDAPVVVHQVFIPLDGPVRSLCGATGPSVMRSEDVTCRDCRGMIAQGTWRTVFDAEKAAEVVELPDGRTVDAAAWARGETILRTNPLAATLRRGPVEVGEQFVTDVEADPCPAWCDRTSGHSCTGEDFHHSGARTVEGLTVVLRQYPGEPVTVTLHSDDDRLLDPFAAKRIGWLLKDVEKAVAETARCPSWCDQNESHSMPGLDVDHYGSSVTVPLAAHQDEFLGGLVVTLFQRSDEAEPEVHLSGPDETTANRLTLAEAELLHAALSETLAAARKVAACG